VSAHSAGAYTATLLMIVRNNYLLTYDAYVPLYNRFHRGEWIKRVSGEAGALDTPGPLNGANLGSWIPIPYF